jgi:hypothetical protein
VDHSGGKFGFSVQKNIYVSQKCGGVANGKYDSEAFSKLCNMNGWDRGIKYDLESHKGHLPFTVFLESEWGWLVAVPSWSRRKISSEGISEISSLFSRTQACEL